MAQSNQKGTTRSKSQTKGGTTRGTTRKGSPQKKQSDFASFHDEIIIIVSVALMVILLLSNFSLCGKIGDAVSGFFFGIFGWIHYILPVALFLCVSLLISNGYSSLAIKKVCLGVLCTVMLTALFQMFISQSNTKLLEAYAYSSENKSGGGIVGAAIYSFLHTYLGSVGAYIVVVVTILITFVLITETSFLDFMKKGSNHIYQNVKETQAEAAKRTKDRPVKEKPIRQPRTRAVRQSNPRELTETNPGNVFKHTTVLPVQAEEPVPIKKRNKQQPDVIMPINFPVDLETGEILEAEEIVATNIPDPIKPVVTKINPIQIEEPINTMIEPDIVPAMARVETAAAFDQTHETKPSKGRDKQVDSDVIQINTDDSQNLDYHFPPLDLLQKGEKPKSGNMDNELRTTAVKLQQTLANFGVGVTMTNVSQGPAVTRYEMQPEQGVKVSKIVSLADDIKLNLAAADIRIEAPIPGKAAIGIEVPNKTNSTVMFRDLIENDEFRKYPSDIAFAVGKDIGGKVVFTDIGKMPHLLIAGATGSGKSVCINTLIMSILYKADPKDVKLIMIDPKVVELSTYNGIPHLLIPVVTDPKKASGALNWAVMEMTDRYKKFAEVNVRNLKGYNKKVEEIKGSMDEDDETLQKLPQIIIIVDELADLMMVAPGEVEDAIVRLSQLARAAGIHLVIATQRPSVNVITGLIKANVPSRIAFAVSSGVDSRTIIDMNGAEKLLGKGDMLFYPQGYQKPVRVQGAFISDKEVSNVVDFLKEQGKEPEYNEEVTAQISSAASSSSGGKSSDKDEYFAEAGRFIIDKDRASIGMLQRVYKIGFNRAARIMDQLSDAGVVGPEEGTKPRKVIMSPEEFEQYVEESV